MDIDPKTYPSRNFVRFTAHNQLMADATGVPFMAAVQRLGGKTYTQEAIPNGEVPSITTKGGGLQMGMSLNTGCVESPPHPEEGEEKTSPFSNELSSLASDFVDQNEGIDEALFEEVVKNTINPNRFPDLYRSCGTQEAAMAVEAMVAAEIVSAYRRIKRKQDCPIVQDLNKLL